MPTPFRFTNLTPLPRPKLQPTAYINAHRELHELRAIYTRFVRAPRIDRFFTHAASLYQTSRLKICRQPPYAVPRQRRWLRKPKTPAPPVRRLAYTLV